VAALVAGGGTGPQQKRDIEDRYLDERKCVAGTVTQHMAVLVVNSLVRSEPRGGRRQLRQEGAISSQPQAP
jgi:hypothetical protein